MSKQFCRLKAAIFTIRNSEDSNNSEAQLSLWHHSPQGIQSCTQSNCWLQCMPNLLFFGCGPKTSIKMNWMNWWPINSFDKLPATCSGCSTMLLEWKSNAICIYILNWAYSPVSPYAFYSVSNITYSCSLIKSDVRHVWHINLSQQSSPQWNHSRKWFLFFQ